MSKSVLCLNLCVFNYIQVWNLYVSYHCNSDFFEVSCWPRYTHTHTQTQQKPECDMKSQYNQCSFVSNGTCFVVLQPVNAVAIVFACVQVQGLGLGLGLGARIVAEARDMTRSTTRAKPKSRARVGGQNQGLGLELPLLLVCHHHITMVLEVTTNQQQCPLLSNGACEWQRWTVVHRWFCSTDLITASDS